MKKSAKMKFKILGGVIIKQMVSFKNEEKRPKC